MKRPEGVSIISIYYYLVAGLSLLGACAIVAVPIIVGWAASQDPDARMAVPIVAVAMGVALLCILAIGGAYGAVAWGLWNMKPWARLGAVVLAVLNLLSIPVGTIIGGLILWYLYQPEARAAFGETVPPPVQ